MTLESTSSGGWARDAVSGRPKVAIVTGASSGIGLEVAKRLIEKGYRVVANSRKITSAKTLDNTADLKLVDGDIGVEETAKHVVSTAIQSFGAVDLLVNNASVFIPKPFTEYTAEDFRRATQTNLAGFFYVSQLAVAQNASPEIRTRRQHLHVVGKPAYRRSSRKPCKPNQGRLGVRHTSAGD